MEQKIKNFIAETLAYILKNPATFFSEADLQAIFYARLMSDPHLRLYELYETNCTIGRNSKNEPSKSKYKTTLLHREYGINDMANSRSDMVIFDPIEVGEIIDPINLKRYGPKDCNNSTKKQEKKYLTPDYIFEFGTDKSAGCNENLKTHIANDLDKLHKAKRSGYLIHIQRNYLLGGGSDRNNKKHKEFADTADIIMKEKAYKNVKVLYFMVDVGGAKRGIYKKGKVKYSSNGDLKGIAQKNLKNTILQMMH